MAAAVAAPARAADMAPPAPAYYPPAAAMAPAVYDWTGIYFGGHVGAGLLKDNVNQLPGATVVLSGNTSVSPVGLIGGAQLGVNFEAASWVFGAEASWTDSAITGSANTTTVPATGQERATEAPMWIAAATGHLGYAFNTLLVYAKGGGAYMNVNYTQDQLTGGVTTGSQSISDNRTGFTVGVGLEYGMTENLSAKLEYDFYDFGTRNYGFTATPVSISSDLHALTVGLNYRFNWNNGAAVERCPTC
jgi:outer membrane immunogenic protein